MICKIYTFQYENTVRHDSEQETYGDEDVEDNIPERTSNNNPSSSSYPTKLYDTNGPILSPGQVLNIAPGEGKVHVSPYNKENWEALTFPREYSHE